MAGLTSVILVDIIAMGRIGFALCRDGLLPASVGKIDERFQTPLRITAGTTIAVVVLRRTKPTLKRPFRTPQVPWLPATSAVLCVGLTTNLAVETWLRFVIWMVLGLVVYWFYGRKHAKLGQADRDAAGSATSMES